MRGMDYVGWRYLDTPEYSGNYSDSSNNRDLCNYNCINLFASCQHLRLVPDGVRIQASHFFGTRGRV